MTVQTFKSSNLFNLLITVCLLVIVSFPASANLETVIDINGDLNPRNILIDGDSFISSKNILPELFRPTVQLIKVTKDSKQEILTDICCGFNILRILKDPNSDDYIVGLDKSKTLSRLGNDFEANAGRILRVSPEGNVSEILKIAFLVDFNFVGDRIILIGSEPQVFRKREVYELNPSGSLNRLLKARNSVVYNRIYTSANRAVVEARQIKLTRDEDDFDIERNRRPLLYSFEAQEDGSLRRVATIRGKKGNSTSISNFDADIRQDLKLDDFHYLVGIDDNGDIYYSARNRSRKTNFVRKFSKGKLSTIFTAKNQGTNPVEFHILEDSLLIRHSDFEDNDRDLLTRLDKATGATQTILTGDINSPLLKIVSNNGNQVNFLVDREPGDQEFELLQDIEGVDLKIFNY